MSENKKPGIYLLTDTGTEVKIILVGLDGETVRLPRRTPVDDLVAFVGRDFSDYKKNVEALWEEHDVFKERDVVPFSAYEDFEQQALPVVQLLRELDPVSYQAVAFQVAKARKMSDNGSTMFASKKAFKVLNALRIPYRVQNRMRNIFEIAFADFERGTQQDRFLALEETWPGIIDRSFTVRFVSDSVGTNPISTTREYRAATLYELYLIELSLYFQQSQKRIARCENCWRYFVPQTDAQSRYCYGKVDGQPCKKIGAKFMRKFRADTDQALATYERLRRKLEERAHRYETALPENRDNLIPFDREKYEQWLDMARTAKKNYQAQKITAEDFLREIDVFNELDDYCVEVSPAPDPNRTLWRERIRKNIDFEPEYVFVDMSFLDLSEDDPEWSIITREQQILTARCGLESLHDRYGTDARVEPITNSYLLDAMHPKENDEVTESLSRFIRDAAMISLSGEWTEKD